MNRKAFLKTSSIAFTGLMIAPQFSCTKEKKETGLLSQNNRTNWAKNYTYKAKELFEPKNPEEVSSLIKDLESSKALGSKHCFNDIADDPVAQISTQHLNKVISIDPEKMTITVEAGARYGDFSKELYEKGFALHNLASLPHITVAGACATATHGSGVKNGNLATGVMALELVKPDGKIVSMDRSHPDFNAVVVGLGAFGIITKMTLAIQPAFDVQQDVFLDLPLESVRNNFNEIMSSGYSVSLFTNWMNDNVSEVWVKRRTDEEVKDLGSEFYGAKAAEINVHPIFELDAQNCTEQLGVPGPWYDRLPHFKMGFLPSAGEELQAEFFVPRENAVEAIMEIEKLKDEIYPLLMITEIRTICGDEFWMSPCYQQDSVAIHFTWKQMTSEVMAVLPKIEAAIASFNGVPHWGKLFTISREKLMERYPKFNDFVALAKQYDPQGKFINDYLKRNIY